MEIVITGSSGLIGSEAFEYFAGSGHRVHGIDNNMRADFFGPQGDTTWRLRQLVENIKDFKHHGFDIRNRTEVLEFFSSHRIDAVVHCAAQPSHDLAKDRPFDDFDVNAGGTLNFLEAARRYCPEAPFFFMNTNTFYGDAPNELALLELPARWEYADPADYEGIDETGPNHSGVELHGFLNFLVKTVMGGKLFTVFGYKGKQVGDQIHSIDVVRAFEAFIAAPRVDEVYNLGGGRESNVSILECVEIEAASGRKVNWRYDHRNRVGDHICYISNMSKFCAHFPEHGH